MNILINMRKAFAHEMPFFMALPAFVWQMLFLYIPLICVVALSFLRMHEQFSLNSLTVSNYGMLQNPLLWAVIARSLVLAFCAACTCAFFAYPVAYYIALHTNRFKNIFIFFLILPFWTNMLVQVYAWFFVLEKNGLINTLLLNMGFISEPIRFLNTAGAVYIVMVYCYLPFMAMPIYSILDRFDKRLIEASLDLGATPWRTFLHITLPLSFSGIRTGFFLVFVPAFGEFVIPVLMGGGKKMFVGSLISYYFLAALDTHRGAVFTVVSALILLIVSLALNKFLKWLINVFVGKGY